MGPAVRRLLPYMLRHRRRLSLGLGCVVMMSSVSLLSPWVLKYAIDDLTVGVTRAKLGLYASLLLGIAVVGAGFRFLMRRLIVGVSREIEYDVRNDFYAHLERLSVRYFQSERTGDIMSRATNDLNAVRMMTGPAIMYSVNTVLTFSVAILLMLSIDVRLTAIALLPLPFVSLLVKVFGSAIHHRFEAIQAQLSNMSAVVQEALAGVRVVRAYRQEASELARFREANREYLERNRGLIRLQGLFFPSLALFLGFGGLLVLWLGSREVVLGRISVGEFVAFNAYLVMLSWPMIAFGWVTNMLQRGLASWKRMLQVFDAVPDIGDAVEAEGRTTISGGIELRGLTFAYGDGEPVLRDLSLRVEPGQTLALVGGTGSGKSTLLGLIPRLFDPPPGTVFVDGVDVRDIPLDQLRGAIGYVPQEPFLFSTTLRDNVAFGLAEGTASGALADTVEAAASVACLDGDIAEFPRGYDTLVGERGITLSGGQKQRAALARALTVDPRILILDDALSAVDTYTEERILAGLREVRRQRTSIIVAHRMSTVRDADIIAVLDQGRLVERGSHDELIALDGVYAELYRKQLLEDELAAS
ncbi:MAG: ABC transporter ATP-binding protein [Vicinamibacterales bacterium]|nr:multidrug ABC transporter ATP-binding protein [Acidobacteriota bacterium]MDP6370989.1 ABC transporter ATP-binding protein [Vicinamibacterales bacterium]MDP6610358.1 ABC transporter ATP-binding protein [Vicinamibacterales bacterium]HAK55536.1 ABC transporter ATP-binding protein [Acidobacteriota bacterium]